MVTLDSYVAEKAIGRIDLIKIDVEGYEPFVLEGAFRCIRRYKPIIVCEIANTRYLGKTAEILKKICVECGYKMKFADGRRGEPNLNKILAYYGYSFVSLTVTIGYSLWWLFYSINAGERYIWQIFWLVIYIEEL